MKRLLHFLSVVPLLIFLLAVKPALALNILPDCANEGKCTLCDIVQVFINFGLFLIAISGAVALFFIVYGGFMWLISAGSPEKISKGKSILINAAIGITIAFTAYIIITTFVALVSNNWNWQATLTC